MRRENFGLLFYDTRSTQADVRALGRQPGPAAVHRRPAATLRVARPRAAPRPALSRLLAGPRGEGAARCRRDLSEHAPPRAGQRHLGDHRGVQPPLQPLPVGRPAGARDGASSTSSSAAPLIDELARMEVFQVNFGGGEPFLRDDFLDILALRARAGHHHLREHQRDGARRRPRRRAPVHDGAGLPAGEPRRRLRRDQRRHPRRRGRSPASSPASSCWPSAAIPTSASTWWSPG